MFSKSPKPKDGGEKLMRLLSGGANYANDGRKSASKKSDRGTPVESKSPPTAAANRSSLNGASPAVPHFGAPSSDNVAAFFAKASEQQQQQKQQQSAFTSPSRPQVHGPIPPHTMPLPFPPMMPMVMPSPEHVAAMAAMNNHVINQQLAMARMVRPPVGHVLPPAFPGVAIQPANEEPRKPVRN